MFIAWANNMDMTSAVQEQGASWILIHEGFEQSVHVREMMQHLIKKCSASTTVTDLLHVYMYLQIFLHKKFKEQSAENVP